MVLSSAILSSPAVLAQSAARGAADIYHPPAHSNTALDVGLATIASVLLLLAMIIPPAVARSRETRRLAAEQPDPSSPAH
jgi:hypothetical protein